MNHLAIGKQAQPLERPYAKQVGLKSASCQPLRTNCQPLAGGLQKDTFMSSKPKANTNLSFGSKLKNAVKELANFTK